jgi:hypothetical protein
LTITGEAAAAGILQHVAHQRGLPGAEEAGDDRAGHLGESGHDGSFAMGIGGPARWCSGGHARPVAPDGEAVGARLMKAGELQHVVERSGRDRDGRRCRSTCPAAAIAAVQERVQLDRHSTGWTSEIARPAA